jgi:hypothetical protein
MVDVKNVYPVCFWCGAVFDIPVALGDDFTPEEKAAIPDECVLHYDPCQTCMQDWVKGRVFIEYSDEPANAEQPPLTRADGTKFYPTGRLAVLTVEKAESMFDKDGSGVEPISFLSRENFSIAFEREPEESCFWCGAPKSGVESEERRLKVVSDYEPCNACRAEYAGKCVILECDYTSAKAIRGVSVKVNDETMYPTGRLMRLEIKTAKRLFGASVDVGEFMYVSSEKFKVLAGEKKMPATATANAGGPHVDSAKPKRGNLLQRTDEN